MSNRLSMMASWSRNAALACSNGSMMSGRLGWPSMSSTTRRPPSIHLKRRRSVPYCRRRQAETIKAWKTHLPAARTSCSTAKPSYGSYIYLISLFAYLVYRLISNTVRYACLIGISLTQLANISGWITSSSFGCLGAPKLRGAQPSLM